MTFVKNNSLPIQYKLLTVSVLSVMASQVAVAEDKPTTTLQTITIESYYDARQEQNESVYAEDSVAMQQATHLSDYLNDVPGVSINGTSSVDQGINIRGVRDTDLKVTVDGVRQENHFFHHMTNLALDSDLYKEAEVSVGNNSVTLGNNARGGAVEFKTVDAEDLLKVDQSIGARVKVGYATNDEQVHTVGTVYGKPTDNSDVLLSYGVRSADQGEDGAGNPLMSRESDITNILAKLSVTPAEGHKVTASFSRYEDEGVYYNGGDKYNSTYTEYTDEDFVDRENTNDQYSLTYEYDPSDDFGLELKAYRTERSLLIRGSEGGVDGITAKAQNKLTQGIGDNEINHKLVYGAEAYRKHSTNNYVNTRGDGETINEKQETDIYGVYIEDQIDMGRFHVTPGVRYDHATPASNVSTEDYSQVSGALAAGVDVTDNISVFGSYTQFFNAPPLPETIFNNDGSGVYAGNDLEAETGANAEVGISANFDNLLSSDDYLTFVAKGFQTNYDNAISYDRSRAGFDCTTGEAGGSCARYVNSDEVEIEGYEVSTTYGDGNASVTASYSHAEDDLEDAYTIRQSGDTFALGYNYAFDNGSSIGGRMNHVENKEIADVEYDGYTTFDVYGSYVPTALPDLKLDLGVYNIGDTVYSSTSNYAYGGTNDNYAMGRNVKVAATYQF